MNSTDEAIVTTRSSNDPLRQPPVIRLPTDSPPILLVMVDAEEEFDWDAGFDRANTDVTSITELERAHEVFDPFGVKPTYVVDHPVAECDIAAGILRGLLESGRCEIGAHLHPWVTPPFDEEVNRRNSFPGNLPPQLEDAKLTTLVETLEQAVGQRPVVYQAGRYGIGRNTAALLERLGFEVDFSAAPPYDYSSEGGPDFSAFRPEPYWFGPGGRLLGLPLTGAFVGLARNAAPRLYRAAIRPPLSWCRTPAILSRLGLVDRLRLSPEGFRPSHMRNLTMALHGSGVRTFVLSFHTPSLKIGCTPYVRSDADRQRFLSNISQYLEWFFKELGGITMTATQLRRHILDLTTST